MTTLAVADSTLDTTTTVVQKMEMISARKLDFGGWTYRFQVSIFPTPINSYSQVYGSFCGVADKLMPTGQWEKKFVSFTLTAEAAIKLLEYMELKEDTPHMLELGASRTASYSTKIVDGELWLVKKEAEETKFVWKLDALKELRKNGKLHTASLMVKSMEELLRLRVVELRQEELNEFTDMLEAMDTC